MKKSAAGPRSAGASRPTAAASSSPSSSSPSSSSASASAAAPYSRHAPPPNALFFSFITFCVSVPVLSEKMYCT